MEIIQKEENWNCDQSAIAENAFYSDVCVSDALILLSLTQL